MVVYHNMHCGGHPSLLSPLLVLLLCRLVSIIQVLVNLLFGVHVGVALINMEVLDYCTCDCGWVMKVVCFKVSRSYISSREDR